jgi:hypothetical protein
VLFILLMLAVLSPQYINSSMGEHIKVFENTTQLGEAAEALLGDHQLDMVVVTGFSDRIDGRKYDSSEELYRAVPELHDVNDVLIEWAATELPNNFAFYGMMSAWLGNWSNNRGHIDAPQKATSFMPFTRWYGPITGTILHRHNPDAVVSRFSAQAVDLPYQPESYESWSDYNAAYLAKLSAERSVNAKGLRTQRDQALGDLTLFRNVPYPTAHSVELIGDHRGSKNRMAQIITSYVVDKNEAKIPELLSDTLLVVPQSLGLTVIHQI